MTEDEKQILMDKFWKALEKHYPEPEFTENLFHQFLDNMYASCPYPIEVLDYVRHVAKTDGIYYDDIPIGLPKEEP